MSEQKKPGRLRWKMRPRKTGLRAIMAEPRGSDYTNGVTRYAWAYAHGRGTGKTGWWWGSNASGSVVNNTHLQMTEDEAKRQAQGYVREQLAKKESA